MNKQEMDARVADLRRRLQETAERNREYQALVKRIGEVVGATNAYVVFVPVSMFFAFDERAYHTITYRFLDDEVRFSPDTPKMRERADQVRRAYLLLS